MANKDDKLKDTLKDLNTLLDALGFGGEDLTEKDLVEVPSKSSNKVQGIKADGNRAVSYEINIDCKDPALRELLHVTIQEALDNLEIRPND